MNTTKTPITRSNRPHLRLVKAPSPMARLRHRVTVLEGQMNALAQAWLYLAAETEMQGGFDLERMKTALQQKYWPDDLDVSVEGERTVKWLCRELTAARNVRAARARDQNE